MTNFIISSFQQVDYVSFGFFSGHLMPNPIILEKVLLQFCHFKYLFMAFDFGFFIRKLFFFFDFAEHD